MSASGGDDRQPPVPVVAPQVADDTREPFGFNLGDTPLYEQPPLTLYASAGTYGPALPTGQAIAGFVVSLAGLVCLPFLNVFSAPAVIVGLVLSAIALRKTRQGLAGGKGFAVAGLVLGIVGAVLTALLIVAIVALLAWGAPV
jgi:hypothetical protein